MTAVGLPSDAATLSLTPEVLPAAATALGLPSTAGQDAVHAAVYRITGTADVFASSISLSCETLLACTAPAVLARNTHLLYALLRERTIIDGLAKDPSFERAASPLAQLVAHFSGLVARAEAERALAAALAGSGGEAEAIALRTAKAKLDAGPPTAAGGMAGSAPGGSRSSLPAGSDGLDADTSALAPSSADGTAAGLAAGGRADFAVSWEEADVLAVLAAGSKSGNWPGSDSAAAVAVASAGASPFPSCRPPAPHSPSPLPTAHIFEYKEAHNPEAFFVPYLWSLAYGYCAPSIGWKPKEFAGATAPAGASSGVGAAGAPPAGPSPLFVLPPLCAVLRFS